MSAGVSAQPASVPLRDLGTIETIETIPWKRQPNLFWARAHTSVGAVGLGETYYLPGAVERVIHDFAVPQGVSERLISRFAFREVLQHQSAHVLLVDIAWTGGITEARRVAELASTYHLSFAPHDCTGP